MEIIKKVATLRTHLQQYRQAGDSIGFVPTMGFLHQGHLELMCRARRSHDAVVASIFVNPLQFGPGEDYHSYPRDFGRDSCLAAAAGVDVLFAPPVEEFYPGGYESMRTFVEVGELGERLCGATRPGHFRGVTTVVAKLFHIVEPDTAYFGEKDAQQAIIIRRMVENLNMNVKIVTVPTVRERDGLAMSSRNVALKPAERQAAALLYQSLRLACARLESGESDTAAIAVLMRRLLTGNPLIMIEYISFCDPQDLTEIKTVDGSLLVVLAVRIGKTRLIDNLVWPED